jgi:hypothetical protein
MIRVTLSSSRNAVSFSFARTTKRSRRRNVRQQGILFACRDFNEPWTLRRETRNRDAASAAAYPATFLTPVRAILLVVDRVLARLEVLAAVRALPHPRWRIGFLLHRHLFSSVL